VDLLSFLLHPFSLNLSFLPPRRRNGRRGRLFLFFFLRGRHEEIRGEPCRVFFFGSPHADFFFCASLDGLFLLSSGQPRGVQQGTRAFRLSLPPRCPPLIFSPGEKPGIPSPFFVPYLKRLFFLFFCFLPRPSFFSPWADGRPE